MEVKSYHKPKKEIRPTLASRVAQECFDFYVNLAINRSEYISDVVRTALIQYKEKIEELNEKRKSKD